MWRKGVSGTALQFDGYYSGISVSSQQKTPEIKKQISEAVLPEPVAEEPSAPVDAGGQPPQRVAGNRDRGRTGRGPVP